jgi:hypothetical protein
LRKQRAATPIESSLMSNALDRETQRKMSDMPSLPNKPTLTLPPAAYPARKPAPPPQQPPPVTKAEAPAKPKPIEPLGPAELIIHNAIRDGARIALVFLDGERFDVKPLAIGKYSMLVETADGAELAVFKVSLKYLGRARPNDSG